MADTPHFEADYSIRELMAVFLARDLADGDELQVGVALPVPEAAVRLAHIMHGPNMDLIFLGVRMNVHHLEHLPLPAFGWDCRVVRWAESFADRGHRFDNVRDWGRRVFFVGGLQVDPFGNINLIGIGSDPKHLRMRGPGSVGTPSLTTHVGRYYIVLNHHDRRTLVERCDWVSAVGWHIGGADARTRLGLPGGGPKYCVTPLAVLDFAEDSKRMRLHSLHPGVSLEQVRDHTGFDLIVPEHVPTTAPPSPRELEVLRSRVDPDGRLRSP
jgi:glutaconate CoA-transferase subunit B